VVKNLQHFMTGQADDGITAPFLAALNGLEQIGIRPAGELEVGAQRRIEVGQHLAVHRDAVKAGVGELGELLGFHGTVS
jgi:ABC-type branched-subunit amino acid transport system ATPase component